MVKFIGNTELTNIAKNLTKNSIIPLIDIYI